MDKKEDEEEHEAGGGDEGKERQETGTSLHPWLTNAHQRIQGDSESKNKKVLWGIVTFPQ